MENLTKDVKKVIRKMNMFVMINHVVFEEYAVLTLCVSILV